MHDSTYHTEIHVVDRGLQVIKGATQIVTK